MIRFPTAAALFLMFCLTPPIGADAAPRAKHGAAKPPTDQVEVTTVTGRLVPVAPPGSLRSVWTQYGPHGAEVRAVVEDRDCPQLISNLRYSQMNKRAAADSSFLTICSAVIPSDSKLAALVLRPPVKAPPTPDQDPAAETAWVDEMRNVEIVPLALPSPDPQRIVVLGDTGCRIKGKTLQDCSDPAKWPFARIASEAAKLKPDLVIHVGDYLYRESACPPNVAGCAGTPFGDNWVTWDADFFTPAKPLLAAAPWVMVRGNHEDCGRAGPGWLRLLGPGPYDRAAPCEPHLPPYTLALGQLHLIVMDDVDAPDTSVAEGSLPVYRRELAELSEAKPPTWLLMHKPIWAAVDGPLGMPIGGNATMIAAAGTGGIAAPVELLLAGHIHSFEAINYASVPRVPPQIVAGFGGDLLDDTPLNLRGTIFQGDSGVRVTDGLSVGGFGFLLMTKLGDGWTIDVHDWQGRIERRCDFRAGRVDCPKPRR